MDRDVSGDAGTAIPLPIGAAAPANLSIVIAGVPSVASLSAGTKNADGSWRLTPEQLAGLTLSAPAGAYAGPADLTVTATANRLDGTLDATSANLTVLIAGVATAPTLSVQNASGEAGTPIALQIASALTATDGAETLSIRITGVPSAAALSAGNRNSDGSWTLTAAQLANLFLTVPAGGFAGVANLTVTSIATETNGSTAAVSAALAVAIAGVATAPTLNVQNASGNAGTAIALPIDSALTATDGTETLSITIAGVPSVAALSAGIKNADGTWTLTEAQLVGLALMAPTGSFAGIANLTVTSTATEIGGSTASVSAALTVNIAGVASPPTLNVLNISGGAGSAIPLLINSALTATDGTETLSIAIAGVPSVATLSAGIKNADGTWTLTPAQLARLALTVPRGSFAGTANLTVVATATETNGSAASSAANLSVSVAGPMAVENAGNVALVTVGGHYGLYGKDGAGNPSTGPLLQYQGSYVQVGQFPGWTPVAAEATGGGYEVALANATTQQAIVWNVDADGNWLGYLGATGGVMDFDSPGLWSFEPQFNFDLNGDGKIGAPVAPSGVIESVGNLVLVAVGGYYGLYGKDGSGNPTTGPLLQYQGAAVTPGRFPGWSPVAAEQTASGYEVALENTATMQFSVWNVDSGGNFQSGTVLGGALDNADGTGSFFLQGAGLTVARSPTQLTVTTAAGNTFAFKGHASESITVAGLANETFVFSPGAGQDILYGFVASGVGHDTLQFNASAFGAGLTAADENANWLAMLAHTADNAAGSAVITDLSGGSITLDGISKATLAALGNVGEARFV